TGERFRNGTPTGIPAAAGRRDTGRGSVVPGRLRAARMVEGALSADTPFPGTGSGQGAGGAVMSPAMRSDLTAQIERLRARAELFQDWLWTHPQRQSEELYRSVEAERDLLLAEMRRLQRDLAATERNSEQSIM